METILIILLVIIIGVQFYSVISLSVIKKLAKKGIPISKDESYLDLKYQVRLITTVFSIGLAIISFLGYATYGEIKNEVEKEFAPVVDSLKRELSVLNQDLTSSIESYHDLDRKSQTILDLLNSTDEGASIIKKRIDLLNRVDVNSFYKCSYEFTYNSKIHAFKQIKISFIDLKGDKLPKFNTPPFVVLSEINSASIIVEQTKEHFTTTIFSANEGAKIIYNVLIIPN